MPKGHDSRLIEEKSIGDGSCCPNSFALGFATTRVLLDIVNRAGEREPEMGVFNPRVIDDPFIKEIMQLMRKLGEPEPSGFNDVITFLTKLHATDPKRLQTELAPIFRRLVYQLSDNETHLNRTIQPLLSSFEKYSRDYAKIEKTQKLLFQSGDSDDIFIVHDFIFNMFKELRQMKGTLEEKQQMLETWWRNEAREENAGFQEFRTRLRRPGAWLGDLELKLLGEFFNTTINVQVRDHTHCVHSAVGTIPLDTLRINFEGFSPEKHPLIQALMDRGIVDRKLIQLEGGFALQLSELADTKEAARQNLLNHVADINSVEKGENVREYVRTFKRANFKLCEIPQGLRTQVAVCEQLIAQKIVEKRNNKYYFASDNLDELTERINRAPSTLAGIKDELNRYLVGIKDAPVPLPWYNNRLLIEELLHRDIIYCRDATYYFNKDKTVIAPLLNPVDGAVDAIVNAWNDAYAPTEKITLKNLSAVHFTNMLMPKDLRDLRDLKSNSDPLPPPVVDKPKLKKKKKKKAVDEEPIVEPAKKTKPIVNPWEDLLEKKEIVENKEIPIEKPITYTNNRLFQKATEEDQKRKVLGEEINEIRRIIKEDGWDADEIDKQLSQTLLVVTENKQVKIEEADSEEMQEEKRNNENVYQYQLQGTEVYVNKDMLMKLDELFARKLQLQEMKVKEAKADEPPAKKRK